MLVPRFGRGVRSASAAAALLAALAAADQVSGQVGAVRYVRDWAAEAHGEEPLFRPHAVAVLPDCSVWVTDPGNGRAYRWDCAGRTLGAVGRKGEGPGEFEAPAVIRAIGRDTVAVWDDTRKNLSFFDLRGRYLASRPLRVTGAQHGFVSALQPLPGERFLAATNNWPGGPPRPNENSSLVWVVDRAGRVEREALRVEGPGSLVLRDEISSTRIDAPFQRRPVFLFAQDGTLLVGSTGHGRFVRYRTGERLVAQGTIDLRLPQAAVTRADRARWADSVRASVEDELRRFGADAGAAEVARRRTESLIGSARHPPAHIAYSVALLADDGNLWLQLHEPRRRAGSRWQVHDARTGALVRRIDVPTSGRVKSAAVRDGALYVIEINEDDVGRLVKYAPAADRPRRR